MRSRGGRPPFRRMVVVVRAGAGRDGAGVGLVGMAFEEPGVPFPQMEETYGGATSYAGDVGVLCSVWGGVRLCQLVMHVSLNSWVIPLATSKASLDERPPQMSCSRSHLGGERLEISGSEKWDGVVGSSQVLTRESRMG